MSRSQKNKRTSGNILDLKSSKTQDNKTNDTYTVS